MKSWICLVVLFAIGTGVVSADEYRDFLSADGKAMRGKVMRYDARSKKVTIQRDTKQLFTVPIRVFSEKDQKYILEWEFNKVFLSDSSFKIDAKRQKVKNKNDNGSINSSSKNENTAYEITLQNKSTSTLAGLKLEYCIFYEQDKSGSKSVTENGVRYGKLDVPSMRPKSKQELMTEPVTIYTHELDSDWYYTDGRKNKISGDVRGIWVRVNMKTKSGKVITRDFCMPDSLSNSQAWATSSKHVGVNK
ncbi:hypothetical protein P4C99_21935 [Pontiellaceae bacterium B1224]|nr:hypothetical protein [Pontiellaceae bacterium B1224]